MVFADEIPAPGKAVLTMRFTGTINNLMAGFYRSKYQPAAPPAPSVAKDDEHHYMFSTQFESCDARRAFPCFDEPNLKATFDLELEIPEDQVALSNMDVKEAKKTKAGLKTVSFNRTPVMSTYVSPAQQPSPPASPQPANSASCWHGPLATSNTSRLLRNESTTASLCQFASTPPKASKNRGALPC